MTIAARRAKALVLAEIYPHPLVVIDSLIRECYNVYGEDHFFGKALTSLDFAIEWGISLNDAFRMQYRVDFDLDTFRF